MTLPPELIGSKVVLAHRLAFQAQRARGRVATAEELLVGWAVLYWRRYRGDDPNLVRTSEWKLREADLAQRVREWADGDCAAFVGFFRALFRWWEAALAKKEAERGRWPAQPFPNLTAVLRNADFWQAWKGKRFDKDMERYRDFVEEDEDGNGTSRANGRPQRADGAGDADAPVAGRARALDGLA